MGLGQAAIETAMAAWTYVSHGDGRSDAVLIGQSLLRVGVARDLELQAGWTPVGFVRTRDGATGAVTNARGLGDMTFGVLYGLSGPNGPVSIQGYVSAPVGTYPLAAGDWAAGARLPMALPVTRKLQIALTPEVDAEVNSSGRGRHATYGGAFGAGYALTTSLSLSADMALFRHEDPAGPATIATAGASLAWQARADTQFDIGTVIGVNRQSPNAQIYVGIAHRF
jgi:hypothetical protein